MDRAVVAVAEVDPGGKRGVANLRDRLRATSDFEPRRIEVRLVHLPDTDLPERGFEQPRVGVHACRDPHQPLWSVVDGVEPGDIGQQRLRGADVRRRLFAPDVLLARLQRHAIGSIPLRVDRDADDASRRLPDVLLQRREERGVRTPVPERDTEPL